MNYAHACMPHVKPTLSPSCRCPTSPRTPVLKVYKPPSVIPSSHLSRRDGWPRGVDSSGRRRREEAASLEQAADLARLGVHIYIQVSRGRGQTWDGLDVRRQGIPTHSIVCNPVALSIRRRRICGSIITGREILTGSQPRPPYGH